MRKAILVLTFVTAAACLTFFLHGKPTHRLTLRAYYSHVQNVKEGMPVCVDGVQVGVVASVIVRPELGDTPVEVTLRLSTPYALGIPAGSIAQVVEPGILRPTVVDIATRSAHGPSLADGGTIIGQESRDDQTAHALGVVVKALADQSKEQARGPETPSKQRK